MRCDVGGGRAGGPRRWRHGSRVLGGGSGVARTAVNVHRPPTLSTAGDPVGFEVVKDARIRACVSNHPRAQPKNVR